jgi:hypothetical protein
MSAQGWRPIVYLGATFGGVMLVMVLACLLVYLIYPKGIQSRSDRQTVKVIYIAAAGVAFGTGLAINHLLQKHFRAYFGSYLDDPDAPEATLPPPTPKVFLRCGGPFPAYRNDLHDAGFCSPGCRQHYRGK